MRSAELKPDIPASLFPPPPKVAQQQQPSKSQPSSKAHRNRPEEPEGTVAHTSPLTLEGDEFGGDDLDDKDVVEAGESVCYSDHERVLMEASVEELDFNDIDTFDTGPNTTMKARQRIDAEQTGWIPEKLDNGKWACNHKCKDKTA